MQHEQKLNLVAALESFMEEKELTQNDVAEGAGVNALYLINMRKGEFSVKVGDKTTPIADKYFHRIAEFIGFELEKNLWETKPTIQLKEMLGTLQDAKVNAETKVIIGESGCGKSFTTDLFKKKFPKDVFVVTVGSSDNLADLLDKVMATLRIEAQKRSKSAKLRQIAGHMKKLSENGLEPLLIFDESEYMKQPTLCAMKELLEDLKKYSGLVLIGTNQLTQNIDRLKKRNKPGIPQYYRRIKFRIRNLPAIDRRFNEFLEGVEPGLKKWLRQNCENYGELHDVLVPAMREAARTNQPLTEDFVKVVLGQ